MKAIGIVALIIFIIVLGSLLLSNKSDKNCQFVAAYEATKNPQDSAEKQSNIYNGYLELCKDPSFDYDLWKMENNIPEE